MRRPGDDQPEPPGGRAAERLREFLGARFGREVELPPGAEEEPRPEPTEADAAEADAAEAEPDARGAEPERPDRDPS